MKTTTVVALVMTIVYPQSNFSQADASIRLRLEDSKTRTYVPYANVSLFKNDSLIAEIITDWHGEVIFEKLDSASFDIAVTHPNYHNLMLKNINIRDSVATVIINAQFFKKEKKGLAWLEILSNVVNIFSNYSEIRYVRTLTRGR